MDKRFSWEVGWKLFEAENRELTILTYLFWYTCSIIFINLWVERYISIFRKKFIDKGAYDEKNW